MKITADFVEGAIAGVLARFDGGCDYCSGYEDEEGNYFEIEVEVKAMLDSLGIMNSVELVWAFDSPSCDIHVLCISYVIDGKLYTNNNRVVNC